MGYLRSYQYSGFQGDPGFFKKLRKKLSLKKLIKVARFVPGVGTVVQAASGIGGRLAGGALSRVRRGKLARRFQMMGGFGAFRGDPGLPWASLAGAFKGGRQALERYIPGGPELGRKFEQFAAKYGGTVLAGAGGIAAGGLAARFGQSHPRVSGGGGRRRMNLTNMRAINRATRRLKGFAKLARTVLVTEKHFKAPKKGSRGRAR